MRVPWVVDLFVIAVDEEQMSAGEQKVVAIVVVALVLIVHVVEDQIVRSVVQKTVDSVEGQTVKLSA